MLICQKVAFNLFYWTIYIGSLDESSNFVFSMDCGKPFKQSRQQVSLEILSLKIIRRVDTRFNIWRQILVSQRVYLICQHIKKIWSHKVLGICSFIIFLIFLCCFLLVQLILPPVSSGWSSPEVRFLINGLFLYYIYYCHRYIEPNATSRPVMCFSFSKSWTDFDLANPQCFGLIDFLETWVLPFPFAFSSFKLLT